MAGRAGGVHPQRRLAQRAAALGAYATTCMALDKERPRLDGTAEAFGKLLLSPMGAILQ